MAFIQLKVHRLKDQADLLLKQFSYKLRSQSFQGTIFLHFLENPIDFWDQSLMFFVKIMIDRLSSQRWGQGMNAFKVKFFKLMKSVNPGRNHNVNTIPMENLHQEFAAMNHLNILHSLSASFRMLDTPNNPDPMRLVVPFDITMQSEALGNKVNFYENTSDLIFPTIPEKIWETLDEVEIPDNVPDLGRHHLIPKALEIIKM